MRIFGGLLWRHDDLSRTTHHSRYSHLLKEGISWECLFLVGGRGSASHPLNVDEAKISEVLHLVFSHREFLPHDFFSRMDLLKNFNEIIFQLSMSHLPKILGCAPLLEYLPKKLSKNEI